MYRPKIEPLGLEFHALRPDIDPTNNILVEMVYDVKNGTEHGLRDFLFPVTARRRMTTCWTRRPSLRAPTCCCWAS